MIFFILHSLVKNIKNKKIIVFAITFFIYFFIINFFWNKYLVLLIPYDLITTIYYNNLNQINTPFKKNEININNEIQTFKKNPISLNETINYTFENIGIQGVNK